MFDESLPRGVVDVPFEVVQWDVVAGVFVEPLEVELEVLGDILFDVELVSCQAVGHVHCGLGQLPAFVCFLLVVVLLGDGVVSVLDHLSREGGTWRYGALMLEKLVDLYSRLVMSSSAFSFMRRFSGNY